MTRSNRRSVVASLRTMSSLGAAASPVLLRDRLAYLDHLTTRGTPVHWGVFRDKHRAPSKSISPLCLVRSSIVTQISVSGCDADAGSALDFTYIDRRFPGARGRFPRYWSGWCS